ncbi:MAG: carbohydrate binding domain-containing protein [Candidatus Omnitrophota bacterium]
MNRKILWGKKLSAGFLLISILILSLGPAEAENNQRKTGALILDDFTGAMRWIAWDPPFSNYVHFKILEKEGPAGNNCLEIEYDIPAELPACTMRITLDVTGIAAKEKDIEEYAYLSFWLKGDLACDNITLNTRDGGGFLSQRFSFSASEKWKEYQIPIDSFFYAWGNDELKGHQVVLKQLHRIDILFPAINKNTGNKGKFYVADLKLLKKSPKKKLEILE